MNTGAMSQRTFLGMSHTPLLGLNTLASEVDDELQAAIAAAAAQVRRFDPQRIVLIGPDHYNGFFNELMPAFCIGTAATAVGDYLTPAGPLAVDSDLAVALSNHLMDSGFDPAISHRMRVDHGFAQALQLLWGSLDTPPVVPIFLNAVAQPTMPRAARCIQLGSAVGAFLDTRPERVLVIGSGGLSHEPPVPTLADPDPAVRERITVRREATAEERAAKTLRVMDAGVALAAGSASIKPLNPRWDRDWMEAIEKGAYADLGKMAEGDITRDAGLSAHESKTWLVARACLGGERQPRRIMRYYRAIPELIAGFGILMLA